VVIDESISYPKLKEVWDIYQDIYLTISVGPDSESPYLNYDEVDRPIRCFRFCDINDFVMIKAINK
jgi:hypothetical protein